MSSYRIRHEKQREVKELNNNNASEFIKLGPKHVSENFSTTV